MGGACSMRKDIRNKYEILVGNFEVKDETGCKW
jgi:hypothetical protein